MNGSSVKLVSFVPGLNIHLKKMKVTVIRKNIIVYFLLIILLIIFIFLIFFNQNYPTCKEEIFLEISTSYTNRRVYDYFPSRYLSNCSTKCNINEEYDIVFLVKSFLKNLDRRNAIRETWGSETRTDNYKFKTVFLMGIDYKNPNVLEEILKENYIYQDIVIGEYQDEYRNNSIKCVMGLDWAKQYCFNSKFYILADDDAYYNTINLMNYLNAVRKQKYYMPNFRYFGGVTFSHSKPESRGKFSITYEEYSRKYYPTFVNGHAMIMSRTIILEFLEAAYYTMFCWLDDVFFGLLAETAGVRIVNVPNSSAFHPGSNVNLYNDIITSHRIPNANELRRIWNEQKKRGNA